MSRLASSQRVAARPLSAKSAPPQAKALRRCARTGTYGFSAVAPVAASPGSTTQRWLQAKLELGAINDPLEAEADRVADAIMKSSTPAASRTTAGPRIQRMCEACKEEETVRAKPEGGSLPRVVPDDLFASCGPGQDLDRSARAFLEPRFAHDFSGVRVHDGPNADAAARSIGARAFTMGRDLVFRAGAYAPASVEGQRLLAHELAHVVQQGAASPMANAVADGPASARSRTATTVQRQTALDEPQPAPEAVDASIAEGDPGATPGPVDAGAIAGVGGTENAGATPESGPPAIPQPKKCGPDITGALTRTLGTVEPWFKGLSSFQQDRSCMALGPAAPLVLVNPIMAWDTRELFLPNTSWLDTYFLSDACGSPRNSGCDSDATRNACETDGTCGNTVVVGGKCMLAGTANYALFGKMCKVCHDYTGRWNRWDMRAIIGAYKAVTLDDTGPPKEMASAAYDGTLPTVPGGAENRGACSDRCGATYGGSFDFIWEPYRSR